MIPAQMRIGSLEILAALAAFGFAVSRFVPEPASADAAMVRSVTLLLAVEESAARGRTREVTLRLNAQSPSAIIGRSAGAAVALEDPKVSRSHAVLALVRGVVYLSDTESSNGTFLNGKTAGSEGIEICAGDQIDVGTTRIHVLQLEAEDGSRG